jgi:hypothetical protein
MSDFYIGYLPNAPKDLARIIKRVVATLFVVAIVIASTLVVAQRPFDASNFEFGKVRSFEGTIQARPYPTLLVTHAGATEPARYLLVAKGKHGADVAAFDGQRVRLRATLIYRDHHTMLEVEPGSIAVAVEEGADGSSNASNSAGAEIDLGPVTLTGEIVDTKCYLGVMNPGRGKVHRDCAARCLSGGIPPALLVRSTGELYLLTDASGAPLPSARFLARAGEPLTLRGTAFQRGQTRLLRVR